MALAVLKTTVEAQPDLAKASMAIAQTVVQQEASGELPTFPFVCQVRAVIDTSISMDNFYRGGDRSAVAQTLASLFSIAIVFDDDGKMPVHTFDAYCKEQPVVTDQNINSYITQNGIGATGGGTEYAKPIKLILDSVAPAGFGGFGARKYNQPAPTLVIFLTDGNCSDPGATENLIRESADVGPIFWQFIGIGGSDHSFPFLQKLDDLTGRRFDNADFSWIQDPSNINLDVLLALFLKEFANCQFLKDWCVANGVKQR